jgi:hypothetical protein
LGFTKIRREIEPRWVSEYVKEFYPHAEVHLRCPLGPIPEELKALYGPAKAAAIHRPWRPEVDAVIVTPGAVILLEAKVQKYMNGLSKLPVYAACLGSTPELQPILVGRNVLLHLLLPYPIPWVVKAAEGMGVTVIDWVPDWVADVWNERDKYWTPEYRMKREERKQLLRKLGFS